MVFKERLRGSTALVEIFSFSLLSLLFLWFYIFILFQGYMTDIPQHLTFYMLFEKGLWDTIPHRAYLYCVSLVNACFQKIDVSRYFESGSDGKMLNFFIHELNFLKERYPGRIPNVSAIVSDRHYLVNLHVAGATVVSIFASLKTYATYLVLKSSLGNQLSKKVLFLFALALSLATAIYIPAFSKYLYAGQGSPTVWHSPTYLLLMPVAIIVFMRYLEFWQQPQGSFPAGKLILLSVLFLLTTYIKPSFLIVMIPTMFLFLLVTGLQRSRVFSSVCMVAPSLLLLLWQYTVLFSGGESEVIIAPFAVWKIYSPNIVVSLGLVLAFPLSVLIADPKKITNNVFLQFSWLALFWAFVQMAFMAESGPRFVDWNFSWGFNIFLFFLYTFSLMALFPRTSQSTSKRFVDPKVAIPVLIFALHVVSGGYYILKIISGRGYA